MSNERLIARGRLDELAKRRFAFNTELWALVEAIREALPPSLLVNDDFTKLKVDEAATLIRRVKTVQAELVKTADTIRRIKENFGFED